MPTTKCNNCGAPLKAGAMECSWCRGAIELEPPPPDVLAASPGASESDCPPPPTPLPAGWVRTVDSWVGYSVAHPPQWTARCEGGVITVSQDQSGTVQAFVWPVQLRSPMHAQQVAQEFVTWAMVAASLFFSATYKLFAITTEVPLIGTPLKVSICSRMPITAIPSTHYPFVVTTPSRTAAAAFAP